MAKTEETKCECGPDCSCNKFTWMNGFKFGVGFALANILGWAIVALIIWLIFYISGTLL
jgi:hypothetical protein